MKIKQVLLLLLSVLVLSVGQAQTIVLNESFEGGAIPADWKQEYGSRTATTSVTSTCPWLVEKGGTRPDGAASGVYRAYFRNETGQTQGYITRLVLPALDLTDVYEPILRFSYAQTKWGSDIDTLRVLYKGSDKASWRVLQEYTKTQPVWKRVEVRLPAVTSTYQIAFEAVDNLGHGIVLDSVQVRNLPECTVPTDLLVSEIYDGGALVSWNADYDATAFKVVVDAVQTYTVSADNWEYRIEGLAVGEHEVTVQAICEGEESEQSQPFRFNVPVEVELPYFYDFNDCPKNAVPWYPTGWSFGNNAGLDAFVSNNDGENRFDRTSADKTPALLFCMDNFYIRSIPAGNYQYAATPALKGAPLNTCRVSFSAGVYEYNSNNFAHSIIVGVMTDAQDVTTFVPVDTVSVTLLEGFQKCYVDLTNYMGNGRFVAFKSDFSKPNNFFIDNVYVKPHDKNDAPTNVHAVGHTNELAIRWEGSADSYGVEIRSNEIEVVLQGLLGDSVVPFDTVLSGVTGTNVLVGNMREWTRYTVRVWAEGGDTSDWTNARTSVPYTLPLIYNFNGGPYDTTYMVNNYYAPRGVQTFGTGRFRPYCGSNNSTFTTYGRSGKGLGMSEGTTRNMSYEYWATYPYMERLDTMRVLFYFSCGHAANAGHAWLSVGVMSDPQDISTYHEMLQCVGTANWERYVIDLQESPLTNGFVVMRWVAMQEGGSCQGWVDDVTFSPRGDCEMIKKVVIDSTTMQYNQVAFRYEAPAGAMVKVRVSTDRNLNDNQIEYGSMCDFTTNNASDSMVTATGLRGGVAYYIYLQPVCDNGNAGLWTNPIEFVTPCAPMTIPYTDNFESWGTGYNSRPTCWSGKNVSTYPQTVSGMTLAHSGSKYVVLHSNEEGDTCSLVTPAISEGLTTIRVRFYAWARYNDGAPLCIGAMSNPDDYGTMDTLVVVRSPKSSGYQLYEYTFTSYTGVGQYLCFMVGNSQSEWFIDDLEIIPLECATPFDIRVEDITPTAIMTRWQGTSQNGWLVIVADSVIDPSDMDTYASHIVLSDTAMEPAHKATGLQAQTMYYLYYRTLCPNAEWADTAIMTQCRDLVMGQVYDMENQAAYGKDYGIPDSAHIECWTMMNNASNNRSAATVPFVYYTNHITQGANKCIYLKSECGADTVSWFALPSTPVEDMTMVNVRFSAWHNYQYDWYDVEVGVMEDPTNVRTFTLVGKVRPTQTKTTYKISLESYEGAGKYIAFRTSACTTPLFVDNIEVVEAPCRNLHPKVSKITYNSVQVNSHLTITNDWIVRLSSEDGFRKDTVITTPRQTVIYGLPSATYITLRAATICSINGTDTIFGDYDELTFLTRCEDKTLADIPFEDFESYKAYDGKHQQDIPCWTLGNYNNANYPPQVLDVTDSWLSFKDADMAHSGDQCLLFYVPSQESDGAYALMPHLSDAVDITNIQVSFWAKGADSWSANKLIVGITTDPSDWASFEPIDTIQTLPNEYSKYLVRFNNYAGDYNGRFGRYVTFATQFGSSHGNKIYVDDVELTEIPHCAQPMDIEVITLEDEQATLVWNGVSDHYRVMLTDTALDEEAWENFADYISNDTTDQDTLTITLPKLAHYYVYVKGLCGDTAGAWNLKGVDFIPACGAQLEVPVWESFETDLNLPPCWQPVGTTYYNTASVVALADSGHTGVNALQLHTYSYSSATATGIILPLLKEDAGNCKVTLWAKTGSKNTSKTVYLSLLSDRDNMTPDSLVQIPILYQQSVYGTDWKQMSFDLSMLSDEQVQGKPYIVLYDKTSNSNYDLYIDDVEIVKMPSCRAPRQLKADMLDGTNARVTLTPFRSYNTDWEIEVMDTLHGTSRIVNTNTLVTTITNLTTDAVYGLSARTVCGTHEQSEWSDTTYLHTVVTPNGLRATATDTTVCLSWENQLSGEWNIYISHDFILPSEVPTVPTDTFEAIITGVTDTFYVYDAQENTKYYILLQSANMGSGRDTYTYTSATTLRHTYEPTNLQVVALLDTTATITWTDTIIKSSVIQLSTQPDFSDTVLLTTEQGIQTYTWDNLQEQTTYYVRVCQTDGKGHYSNWSTLSFTTRCALVDIPFEYGFEESVLPSCWTTVSNSSKYPKAYSKTPYYTEGKQSWEFYATGVSQAPQAIVLPGLKADLTECVLRFKARCSKADGVKYGNATMYVALTNDPAKLTVDNISNQLIVDSIAIAGTAFVQYESDLTSLNPQTIKDLPYIILYIANMADVYIDELIVKESDACRKPMLLHAVSTTGHSATLTFNQAYPAGKWVYAICSDEQMTDTLQADTVYSQTFTVKGLEKTTTYYACVRQLCDEDNVSDVSEPTSFTTMLAPYYEELFHCDTIPTGWTKAQGWIDTIFAGGQFTSASSSWRIQTNNIAISGNHMFYRAYSSWHNDWLLSPLIALDETDSTMLSFDVALTMHDNQLPVPDSKDLRFVVVISTDGGLTWKEVNALSISNLSTTTERYAIDLTPHAGQIIQVGYYVEVTADAITDLDVHLGNVRINYYETDETEVTACEFEDIVFDDLGIIIEGGTYPVGDHTDTTMIPAEDPKGGMVKDLMRKITAHILPSPVLNISDVMCEGDAYNKYGFVNLHTPGTYKRKMTAANHCDSIIVLTLSVHSTSYAYIKDTINQGQVYTFGKKQYTQTGVYQDTLPNAYFCDSVITLALYVNPPKTSEFDAVTCDGVPYEWNNIDYTTPGDHKQTLKTGDGTDSVVTMHLVVNPLKWDTIYDNFTPGTVYNKYDFVETDAGEHRHTVPSLITGCDSTTVLYLTPVTALDAVQAEKYGLVKFVEDNRVIIIRNGKRYSVLGQIDK